MKIEIRSKDLAIAEGYVNAVERKSKPLRYFGKTFVEVVKQGTFADAINEADAAGEPIEMLIDHNDDEKGASTIDGSLTLKEDNIGLYARAEVTNPAIIEEIRNKPPRGWSFGFVAKKDRFIKKEGNLEERVLEKIKLKEVSLLVGKYPAYTATSVEVRNEAVEVEYRCFENIEFVDSVKEADIE